MAHHGSEIVIRMVEKDICFDSLMREGDHLHLECHPPLGGQDIHVEILVVPLHDVSAVLLHGTAALGTLEYCSALKIWAGPAGGAAQGGDLEVTVPLAVQHDGRQDALYRMTVVVRSADQVLATGEIERFILFDLYQSEYLRILEEKHLNPESITYKDGKNFNLLGKKRGKDILNFIERVTPVAGKKLLDLGCATGGPAVAYSQASADVFALDPDPVFVELAHTLGRDTGHPLKVVRGSGYTLPFGDGTVDICVFADVFEHVEYPERILREIHRVLKKQGILYISAPNRFSRTCIRREPHYGLKWIVLMPRRMAAWWVTKVKKISTTYELFKIPNYFTLLQLLGKNGFAVDESWGFEKITPALISGRIMTLLYKVLGTFHLGRLVVNKYHARLRLWLSLESLHFIAFKR